MRLFTPHTAAILTTYRCTAVCRHCALDARPDRRERLSYDQMEKIITQFVEETDVRLVVFTGGEPMLLGEDLYRAIELCKRLGVKVTRVVTNAHWAKSLKTAAARLRELKDAGLDEVNLSIDDWHMEFIPLENIRHAFDAAVPLGFLTVVLSNCNGPSSKMTPKRVLQEFCNLEEAEFRTDRRGRLAHFTQKVGETTILISVNRAKALGRGATCLSEKDFYPLEDIPRELFVGGCPDVLRSVSISPNGHYLSCCGLDVENNPILDYGDLNQLPLGVVLDRADNDLISNMIAMVGPAQIRDTLLKICPEEVTFAPCYREVCELCRDLVCTEQNRRALCENQGVWANVVLQAREQLEREYARNGCGSLPIKAKIVATIK